MSIQVVMPQMGESVAEGTIIKWLVKEGEKVEKDAPLFEISTDKVDAEIPSPESGVLEKILVPEGGTVEVGRVVAELSGEGKAAAKEKAPARAEAPAPQKEPAKEKTTEEKPARAPVAGGVPVQLPQMGESVAEGTIIKWLVKEGERVEKDDPLFEISTDKVDAEIPSPQSGVLTEIVVSEGETVEVGTVVARIGGEKGAAPEREPEPKEPSAPVRTAATDVRSSPIARRIAREHGVDLRDVPGTGREGRVSKKDVLAFVESGGEAERPIGKAAAARGEEKKPSVPAPAAPPGESTVEAMSIMRKKIAEHMVMSKRTSPHVLTVFEVDLSRLQELRARKKKEFEERHGAKLTLTAFVVHAVAPALRQFPMVNASVEGESIRYHKNVNIGIAVALEKGLIVPVIRNVERMGLGDIARSLSDLSTRARSKKLSPDEVQGSTFSITNPGIFGGEFSFPVINQPNVAILGMGGAKKRPVVVGDAIGIRETAYLSLSFDHRAIDGAEADQFMALLKEKLENFSEEVVG